MNTEPTLPLTRDELNEALAKLVASSDDYIDSPVDHYREGDFGLTKYLRRSTHVCAECGKETTLLLTPCNVVLDNSGRTETDPIRVYKWILEEFTKLGYRAELSVYCADCVDETDPETGKPVMKHPRPVVIRLWFRGDTEPIVYYPPCVSLYTRPLLLTLAFLYGKRTITELSVPDMFRGYRERNSAECIVDEIFSVLLPNKGYIPARRNYDTEAFRRRLDRSIFHIDWNEADTEEGSAP